MNENPNFSANVYETGATTLREIWKDKNSKSRKFSLVAMQQEIKSLWSNYSEDLLMLKRWGSQN